MSFKKEQNDSLKKDECWYPNSKYYNRIDGPVLKKDLRQKKKKKK